MPVLAMAAKICFFACPVVELRCTHTNHIRIQAVCPGLTVRTSAVLGTLFFIRQDNMIEAGLAFPHIVIDRFERLFGLLRISQVTVLILLGKQHHFRTALVAAHRCTAHSLAAALQPPRKKRYRQRKQHRKKHRPLTRKLQTLVTHVVGCTRIDSKCAVNKPYQAYPHRERKHEINHQEGYGRSTDAAGLVEQQLFKSGLCGQQTADFLNAGQETRIIIAGLERWEHVVSQYPAADSIGQQTFQSIAGFNAHRTLIGHQQQQQAVVLARLTDFPVTEKLIGKLRIVGQVNAVQCHNRHFHLRAPVQIRQHRVQLRFSRCRQNTIRIGNKTVAALTFRVGNCCGQIACGRQHRRQADKNRQTN